MGDAYSEIAGRSAGAHARRRGARRLRYLLGVLFILAVAGGASLNTLGGSDLASAAISRVKSVLELINQRSPGRRTQAHLIKIKHKHRMAFRPHERALPKIRADLPFPPLESPATLIDLIGAPPKSVPFALNDIPLGPLGQSFPPGIFPPGPPTLIVPPAQSPPASPPPIVTPPLSAVPEPGTWILMLAGFVLAGGRIRRSRPGQALDPLVR